MTLSSGGNRLSKPAIEVLNPDHPDRLAALRIILGGESKSLVQVDRQVQALLDSAERQSLRVDLILAARIGARLVSACVAVESPGRTALVFLGPTCDRNGVDACGVDLLKEMQVQAWARDVVLLQTMLETDLNEVAIVYRDAGFRYLAELVYLDRPLSEPKPPKRNSGQLAHLTYSSELDEQFIDALRASYMESQDCPKLTALRDVRDVLLGHRHTGIYEPELWFLAVRGSKPVGVLLMAGVWGRSCLEIVYMGVVAGERGKNIGDALLSLAIDVGRSRGLEYLTLAVDSTNVHAWRLYQRWGFVEAARRRVWIATASC